MDSTDWLVWAIFTGVNLVGLAAHWWFWRHCERLLSECRGNLDQARVIEAAALKVVDTYSEKQ